MMMVVIIVVGIAAIASIVGVIVVACNVGVAPMIIILCFVFLLYL